MSNMDKYVNTSANDSPTTESNTSIQYAAANFSENTTSTSIEYMTSDISSSALTPSNIAVLAIAVVGIIGNFIVIIVLLNYRAARKKLANLFIINQSFIDLTASILLLCSQTYAMTVSSELFLSPDNFGDEILCRVWITSAPLWSLFMSSGYGILLLSFERYVAIVHPLFHITFFTVRRAAIAMATTWIIGLVFNLLALVPTSDIANGTCDVLGLIPSDQGTTTLAMVTFVLEYVFPVIALIFLYGQMAYVLRRRLNTPKQTDSFLKDKSSNDCCNCNKFFCPECISSVLAGLVRCYESCCSKAAGQMQTESNSQGPYFVGVKDSCSTACKSISELSLFSISNDFGSNRTEGCAVESAGKHSVLTKTDNKHGSTIKAINKNQDQTVKYIQGAIEKDSQCQGIAAIVTPHSVKMEMINKSQGTMKTDKLIQQSPDIIDLVSRKQVIVTSATESKPKFKEFRSRSTSQNISRNVTKKRFFDNRAKSAYVTRHRTISSSSSTSVDCEILATATDRKKTLYNKAHYNIVKTMVTVGVSFVTCWTLNEIVYVLQNANVYISSSLYNASVFLVCMHCCNNPFIYAIQYRDFKTGVAILLRGLSGKSMENSGSQSTLRRVTTMSSLKGD